MKTGIKFLAAACAAILLAGCGGDDGGKKGGGGDGVEEGWMLASWNGTTELTGKVFLQLNEDNTFTLYQCISTPDFKQFTGTYSITPGEELSPVSDYDRLSGRYSDGKSWAYSYWIRAKSNKSMTLVPQSGSEAISVYERVEIPDYVKNPGPKPNNTHAATDVEEIPFL